MEAITQIARLLGIANDNPSDWLVFRTGARTRAVVATAKDLAHRYSGASNGVVVKIYKGSGQSDGSLEYQTYHRSWFQQVDALTRNQHVQKSLEGGVSGGVGPFAVVEFIEGEELADRLQARDLTRTTIRQILEDILGNIWIPLWHAGLRFKDCHPGNFVLNPEGRVVMIDTEQMRKDVDELLHRPDDWTQRDKHELLGLKRLPGLVQRIVRATQLSISDAAVLRIVKAALGSTQLPEALAALGRNEVAVGPARLALDQFMAELRTRGLL